MSSGGGKSKASEGIAQAGATMYERGQMTPQESAQYGGSFDIGNFLKQLMMGKLGGGAMPAGYQNEEAQFQQQGDLAKALYGQTLSGVKDPDALYTSTLQPQLQATQDYINRQYQNRGLIRSGMGIESMGRAGVELSIREAEARMANRQTQMANAGALSSGIMGLGQQNIGNLAGLYGSQQGYGLNAMGRQAGQAQAAAQYQAYPYQAMLGDIYGRSAAMYALPGQIIGAAGQAARGGGTAAAAGGCWVAKEIFGSWEHPKTIQARYYINNIAPEWFKKFYLKNGERIAKFISNKSIFKLILRPLFEIFAFKGLEKSEVLLWV